MTLELHEPTGATPLTPDELLGLRAKHITTRGELNELEGENIIEGLTWLDRRPTASLIVPLRLICRGPQFLTY